MSDDKRRYRKIFIRLWRNPVFRTLADGEKVLALYLLSGPQTNRVGLFPFSFGAAAEDLKASVPLLRKRFQRVGEAFAWQFDREVNVIWIPSWWTFNTPKGNIQNFQGALSDLFEVPLSPLLAAFCRNTHDIPAEYHHLINNVAVPEQCPSSAFTQEKETRQDKQEEDSAPSAAFAPRDLLALWNDTAQAAGLRPCLELTGDRLTHARNRLKEKPARDYWERVITRIASSVFCQGENDRGWKADMDFLLRKGTHVKALEGKYDSDGKAAPATDRRTPFEKARAAGYGGR